MTITYPKTAAEFAEAVEDQVRLAEIGTAVALSDETSILFSGIPADVAEFEVHFDQATLDVSGNAIVRLGDSGGIESTDYRAGHWRSATSGSSLTEFIVPIPVSNSLNGVLRFTRMAAATNTWTAFGGFMLSTGGGPMVICGSKSLSGELTQVQIGITSASNFTGGTAQLTYRG